MTPLVTFASAFDFDGRVAVVTGAASGIGRQTALTMAEAGATVVLADRAATQLEQTAELVRDSGGSAVAVTTDVADRDQMRRLADRAAGLGSLDVWANVAGVLASGSVVDTDEALLDHVLAVNLKGTMWGAAAAGRLMSKAGRGSIVNVASAVAETAAPGIAAYGISKAGVLSLTRTLAVELGGFGVRVNAVAPGVVHTPMTAAHLAEPDPHAQPGATAVLERAAIDNPLGMVGQPIDVALAILYLAADASRFVTGQVLRPNGGMVLG